MNKFRLPSNGGSIIPKKDASATQSEINSPKKRKKGLEDHKRTIS